MARPKVTIDGNEAVADVAYQVNEVIAIYPITPSSAMGEWADQWAAEGRTNIWGTVPRVVEMQSEGGAAGAVHGALQAGSPTTTFTASQGLLLMIPNMYKIAGELTATVFHVAARSVAAQALSIFGDQSDVMATRATGFALLASNSVQEAMDFALIAQAAALEARIPFLHFFDGFRTSHEVMKVEPLAPEEIRAMIDEDLVRAHRRRALSPDRPFIRGTAQNPDVYFQAREAVNSYYLACPTIVQNAMDKFARLVGRSYHLCDYVGAPDADRVLVLMGSGAEAAQETVEYLADRGEKVGLLKVRLYRPFSVEHFVAALPPTVKTLAVLDRTKEPGSVGEPLYLDVITAVIEAMAAGRAPLRAAPRIIGGRYGLSSKEFSPAMIKGIFDEMTKAQPKNHFTIGIHDDVTQTSLEYDPAFSTERPETIRAVFYGLGADGTVGANKNSIKIIGEETDNYAQGYFVYDSKKSGSVTISHLRFGPQPIRSTYLIDRANFVACHQFPLLERLHVLKTAEPGAAFLLNSPYGPAEVWSCLPRAVQEQIIGKKLRFFVIDGHKVAREAGMGGRINTVMQPCFFVLSGVLPRDEAIAAIKAAIVKTYGKLGEAVVQKNIEAVDRALDHLHEVRVPAEVTSAFDLRPPVPAEAPDFVRNVTAKMIARQGDDLPVSALPIDGTYPSGTTKWEKANIALEIPVWDPDICIQCGKCVLVCPHSVIRAKVYEPAVLDNAPATFKSTAARWREFANLHYTLQVSPEDCTGCTLCVEVCPVKNKSEVRLKAINMMPQPPIRDQEAQNWDFFLGLPETDRRVLNVGQVKDAQLLEPLFEFSGACAGCGETPYLKLMSQLFGDRTIIANATGCSSIYGGNLPTTPWTVNREGRGPAWSNSLFEDNAEFGLGIRLALDKQGEYARELLTRLAPTVGDELVRDLLNARQSTEAGIREQRERVRILKARLEGVDTADARDLLAVADALVKKSVWIVGGDGWAYDIGYGGLDHVLASGHNVNLLVLDTEVYSNTGGQASKATPRGAVAKFAAAGKATPKKDLAMMAMTYGYVYVARIAMGGSDTQTIKAFLEAEAYEGPSLIIAYSHCIAHGYDLAHGMEQQKAAVLSGYWPLFRYNPDLVKEGKNPLQLDSKPPTLPLEKYIYNETRYTMLAQSKPDQARWLLQLAQEDVRARWKLYEHWAAMPVDGTSKEGHHG
ncbi:MAG: pyruvate flavodoxin/ferredoxin oxidoreductase domain-containing protein [candidate division NC10 bacterium CSP1-5]|nr:MAG: pyruvate flavodoxin/ferredoxin oxidoreductase domain-containing protein [candidate division NC10 bacterium CSP1-5]